MMREMQGKYLVIIYNQSWVPICVSLLAEGR